MSNIDVHAEICLRTAYFIHNFCQQLLILRTIRQLTRELLHGAFATRIYSLKPGY